MPNKIENLLISKNIKLTDQRKVVAKVISEANDHPDVEELYKRASKIDNKISLTTVYRTVKLFEEAGIIERHDFRDGRSRYEEIHQDHHDHLIDIKSGRVIEFRSEKIEELQQLIAEELGYKLIDHRLELYCVPIEDEKNG